MPKMEKDGQPTYLFGILLETLKTCGFSALFALGILLFVSCYVNNILLYYIGGILFLTAALEPAVAKLRPKKRIRVDGKAVFISGCDSGFGFMLAERLDDIGFHVFAGCLFPDGPGAERLQTSASKRLHIVALDVSSDTSVQKAAAYVTENLGGNLLWGVINNAGILEPGEVSWISTESVQKTIEVNTVGMIRLTKAFMLKLKESKGRIVCVASIAGRFCVPYLVPYSMSKSAVISFCDGLRIEMYKWNIQVITIEPAVFSTPLLEGAADTCTRMWATAPVGAKASYRTEYIEKTFMMCIRYVKNYFTCHPRKVVSVMEEAITALYPEYYYTPGSYVLWFMYWISKALPKPVVDAVLLYLFPISQ